MKRGINALLILATILIASLSSITAEAAIINVNPYSEFDAEYYAENNPDVYAKYGDDSDALLKHYVTRGKFEGRAYAENELVLPTSIEADSNYNVLFIGNSITYHPTCQYWWGSWGMCASAPENDYVHHVVSGLEETYGKVCYDIISYSFWERKNVRSKALPNIDSMLENKYNLIVIQVGDNVDDITTFQEDYSTLITYVKKSVPEAEVILVGDFWYKVKREEIKKNVAAACGCKYVDISYVQNKGAFTAKVGQQVLGDDGQYHVIDFKPVAGHPNDAAMKYIAEQILKKI